MSFFLYGQKTITVKGNVVDKRTRDPLAGASILIPGKNTGTYTNEFGAFEISIPENVSRFKVAYV
ncbi:MAG: carboxypeptidase-like regulatory domain-containing protein, partial [Bacteroidota bacterium]